MASEFAHHWDLDPETTYLNHGSFGPSPVCVQKARIHWSQQLEKQPMRFFCQQAEEQLRQVAEKLAPLIGTKAAHLALVDNATFAMNVVAESIALQPGDQILLTDHEYGAVRNIWQAKCRQSGAVMFQTALPVGGTESQVADAIVDAVNAKTKVVVVSHVTSATALILPLEMICSRIRQKFGDSVTVVVDGPHALAMLDLNLKKLNCDFYCCSCHKWFCGPFGSGFLYVNPRHQSAVDCPVVSWGGSVSGRPPAWQDRTNWLGTRDPSALLAIGATVEFWKEVSVGNFRRHSRTLIQLACDQLLEIEGVTRPEMCADNDFVSMAIFQLPQPDSWQAGYHGHPDQLQLALRDQFRIEAPVFSWNGLRLLRVSAHLYNDADDMERLATAVKELCLNQKL